MSEAQGLTPENITTLMPQLKDNLGRLVTIPSVSSPGFPEETRSVLLEAHQAIVGLLREGGVERFSTLDLPDTAPVITGEIPAPDGAPTVLLYGHYDVVGAGDESKVRHAGLEPELQFVRGARTARSSPSVASRPRTSSPAAMTFTRATNGSAWPTCGRPMRRSST